ncbi:unnamed protein product, partial [Urochloa humidicola]
RLRGPRLRRPSHSRRTAPPLRLQPGPLLFADPRGTPLCLRQRQAERAAPPLRAQNRAVPLSHPRTTATASWVGPAPMEAAAVGDGAAVEQWDREQAASKATASRAQDGGVAGRRADGGYQRSSCWAPGFGSRPPA